MMTLTLGACGGGETEEPIQSEFIGKTVPLTRSILIVDLNPDSRISASSTARKFGMAMSLQTLTSCAGCNYYQGAKFRRLMSPGAQITIKSAYKAVPAKSAVNPTAVNYFVISDADGVPFAMPEYELAVVTAPAEERAEPEVALLETLLGEYGEPAEQRPFFLKVQPNWLKQVHPELTQPYSSEAVAVYFNPLVAGLAEGGFSGLEIHPEEFFITIRANKSALANIIFYSEGLKFDIIPSYGLNIMEAPAAPVISTP